MSGQLYIVQLVSLKLLVRVIMTCINIKIQKTLYAFRFWMQMTKELFLLPRFGKKPQTQQPKPSSYTILLKNITKLQLSLFGHIVWLHAWVILSAFDIQQMDFWHYVAQHKKERKNNPLYKSAAVKSSRCPHWQEWESSLTLGSGTVLLVTVSYEPRWGGSLGNSWGSYCAIWLSAIQSHSFLLCVTF